LFLKLNNFTLPLTPLHFKKMERGRSDFNQSGERGIKIK